jgi:hypothetical protein
MKTLLNYKHNQAIAYNTTSMDRMAQASKKERQLILGLTKATKRDSGSMKLIAVITMIYLPGTFAAVSSFLENIVHLELIDIDPLQHRLH